METIKKDKPKIKEYCTFHSFLGSEQEAMDCEDCIKEKRT